MELFVVSFFLSFFWLFVCVWFLSDKATVLLRFVSQVHLYGPEMPYFSWLMKMYLSGLPWWSSGKESACPCRGHGFYPWSGKIPQGTEQLSPCATAPEAHAPTAGALPREEPLRCEARALQWRNADPAQPNK